jgi:hypothetical protein
VQPPQANNGIFKFLPNHARIIEIASLIIVKIFIIIIAMIIVGVAFMGLVELPAILL